MWLRSGGGAGCNGCGLGKGGAGCNGWGLGQGVEQVIMGGA